VEREERGIWTGGWLNKIRKFGERLLLGRQGEGNQFEIFWRETSDGCQELLPKREIGHLPHSKTGEAHTKPGKRVLQSSNLGGAQARK
jgi:hypothetical protein